MQVSRKQNFVPNIEKHVQQGMLCCKHEQQTTLKVPEMRPLGTF